MNLGKESVFDGVHGPVLLYFIHIIFGYSSWRCPSQSYPVSVPEVSILQIRTKRWEYTAWRDVGAQWNSGGAFTRHRPLWWNDHVMAVYMSSNSMKVISSQFWYLRSIPHHDPAKLHSTICILKYITFIHFCGIFCVVVVWKGSSSSPGHWLSLLSSKYSSIGNGFGDKPSFLSLWFHEQLSFFQFGDNFFVLLYERAVIALQDTAHLRWGRNMRGLAATVVTIRPCVINFSVRMEKINCKKGRGWCWCTLSYRYLGGIPSRAIWVMSMWKLNADVPGMTRNTMSSCRATLLNPATKDDSQTKRGV